MVEDTNQLGLEEQFQRLVALRDAAHMATSQTHPGMAALAAALNSPLEMHIRGAAAANFVLLAMSQAGRSQFLPSDFERLLELLSLGDATATQAQI